MKQRSNLTLPPIGAMAISHQKPIRAIDRLTFNQGDSRIDGRPMVLNPVGWVLAGGRFSGNSALDTSAESLQFGGVGTWFSLVEHCIRDAKLTLTILAL
jgi:hypothetical protein